MLKVWRWVETVVIRIVGRGIEGESRWSVGRMMLRPVRLKTGSGQQFGSGGSHAMFAGIRGSRSRVQRGNFFWSSLVRGSFLKKFTFPCFTVVSFLSAVDNIVDAVIG